MAATSDLRGLGEGRPAKSRRVVANEEREVQRERRSCMQPE